MLIDHVQVQPDALRFQSLHSFGRKIPDHGETTTQEDMKWVKKLRIILRFMNSTLHLKAHFSAIATELITEHDLKS